MDMDAEGPGVSGFAEGPGVPSAEGPGVPSVLYKLCKSGDDVESGIIKPL